MRPRSYAQTAGLVSSLPHLHRVVNNNAPAVSRTSSPVGRASSEAIRIRDAKPRSAVCAACRPRHGRPEMWLVDDGDVGDLGATLGHRRAPALVEAGRGHGCTTEPGGSTVPLSTTTPPVVDHLPAGFSHGRRAAKPCTDQSKLHRPAKQSHPHRPQRLAR